MADSFVFPQFAVVVFKCVGFWATLSSIQPEGQWKLDNDVDI